MRKYFYIVLIIIRPEGSQSITDGAVAACYRGGRLVCNQLQISTMAFRTKHLGKTYPIASPSIARETVPAIITAANAVPRMANIFLRSFCNRPPIPSPSAISNKSRKKIVDRPSIIASLDSSWIASGDACVFAPIEKITSNRRTEAMLVTNDAIPNPECLFSKLFSCERSRASALSHGLLSIEYAKNQLTMSLFIFRQMFTTSLPK